MTDTTTIPPMPDTDCPDWCADHLDQWVDKVDLMTSRESITMSDGTVVTPAPWTAEQIAADFLDMLMHKTRVLHFQPAEDHSYPVDLDVSQFHGETTRLYLSADSPITAAEARTIARALLDAADKVDRINATA